MSAACLLRRAVNPLRCLSQKHATIRNFSFTFAGPRNLDEIIKKDLVEDKTGAEVADVWYTYHETKVRIDFCSNFIRSLFLIIALTFVVSCFFTTGEYAWTRCRGERGRSSIGASRKMVSATKMSSICNDLSLCSGI
jgi:hypothetical protein